MLQEEETTPKEEENGIHELQNPDAQPNLESYYKFVEGGRIIPEKFSIPFFFELEKERGRTHRWMQISKSKKVEDMGLMEEKVIEQKKELNNLRLRDLIIREQLQTENIRLKEKLQEKQVQLATMESLTMEEIQ